MTPENTRALVLRPDAEPVLETVAVGRIQEVLGGELGEHRSPLWLDLRVACWIRDDAFPSGAREPLEPGNIALPTVPFNHADGALQPIFGTVVWTGITPERDVVDLTPRQLRKLRAMIASLPRVQILPPPPPLVASLLVVLAYAEEAVRRARKRADLN